MDERTNTMSCYHYRKNTFPSLGTEGVPAKKRAWYKIYQLFFLYYEMSAMGYTVKQKSQPTVGSSLGAANDTIMLCSLHETRVLNVTNMC